MVLNILEKDQLNKTLTVAWEIITYKSQLVPVKTYWTAFFTPWTVHHVVSSIHNICICYLQLATNASTIC